MPDDHGQNIVKSSTACSGCCALVRHAAIYLSDKRLMEIPGVGPLIATAAVATMGEAAVFKSGREFVAYVGLVPKQTGSGGKVRLLGISKRGDTYLRTLFIHGARAAALLTKKPGPWITVSTDVKMGLPQLGWNLSGQRTHHSSPQ